MKKFTIEWSGGTAPYGIERSDSGMYTLHDLSGSLKNTIVFSSSSIEAIAIYISQDKRVSTCYVETVLNFLDFDEKD